MPNLPKYIGLILIILCYSINSLVAQKAIQDELLLKTGETLYGQIIEQVPGEYIKLVLNDGSEKTLSPDEVVLIKKRGDIISLSKKDRKKGATTFREKGLYHLFSMGYAFGQNQWGGVTNVTYHYSAGYHINQYLNAGIGIGLEPYDIGLITPLYAEVRGDLFKKKITPHYFLRAGYGLPHIRGFWGIPDTISGGLYYHAGAGLKINTRRKFEFITSLGFKQQYTYQIRNEQVWVDWNSDPTIIRSEGSRIYNRIVLQFDFAF